MSSSYTLRNGINNTLVCNFTIGDKDSSGNFTINATVTNTDSINTFSGTPRLSCSLNNTIPWNWISGGTSLSPGGSFSGSTTFSTGITAAGTVYCFLTSDNLTGRGGAYTVAAYVNPTPSMRPITLSMSPTTQVMGENIAVTESGGSYCVVSSRNVTVNGTTVGSYANGTWTVPVNVYEPLCPNTQSINAVAYAACTHTSGATGSGNSNSVNLTLNVPANYKPAITNIETYYTKANDNNWYTYENIGLVASKSKFKIIPTAEMIPSSNSASVTDIILQSVNTTNTSLTVNSFTKTKVSDEYTFTTSSVLPPQSGVPSYKFSLTFKVTDSRTRVSDLYTTPEYTVTNYIPADIQVSVTRTEFDAGLLEVTINGESSSSPSRIIEGDEEQPYGTIAAVKVGNGSDINVKSNLAWTDLGYTLSYNLTGLSEGSQYNVTFKYRDSIMKSYHETNIREITVLLSTKGMPISLYDDGSKRAVSFGEQCASNYTEDTVINFSKDAYIRYADGNNIIIDTPANLFSRCPFPVGGIYMTMDSADPSTIWSGTTWSRMTNGFLATAWPDQGLYAGTTGGAMTHTLTVDELPSHTHTQDVNGNVRYGWQPPGDDTTYSKMKVQLYNGSSWSEQTLNRKYIANDGTSQTSATGSGREFSIIPPFIAVNIWQRTA